MEAKRSLHLLKITMLSGHRTVVAAGSEAQVEFVLSKCRSRLGLKEDGSTMELFYGLERVPNGVK
eukprot:4195007-Amphidinium_carterae.1